MRQDIQLDQLPRAAIQALVPGDPLFSPAMFYVDEFGVLWVPGGTAYADASAGGGGAAAVVLTQTQVTDPASTLAGVVSGQRMAQAAQAHSPGLAFAYASAADRAAQTGYTITQADVDAKRLVLDLDTQSLWLPTGTAPLVSWLAASPASTTPLSLANAQNAASSVTGAVSGATLAQATQTHQRGLWQTFANAAARTGYAVAQEDIDQARVFAQADDGTLWVVTGTVGSPVWAARGGSAPVTTPTLTQVQVENSASTAAGLATGQLLAQAIAAHERGVYATFADSAARTGYVVTQADIDNARLFSQADTGELYVATGTVAAPVWQARGGAPVSAAAVLAAIQAMDAIQTAAVRAALGLSSGMSLVDPGSGVLALDGANLALDGQALAIP